MEEKKISSGGKRPGAGRPRGEVMRLFSVCVSKELDEKLKACAAGSGVSRLAFCRHALGFANIYGVPEKLLGECNKKRGPALPDGRGRVFIAVSVPLAVYTSLTEKAAGLGVSFHCLCSAALIAAVGCD